MNPKGSDATQKATRCNSMADIKLSLKSEDPTLHYPLRYAVHTALRAHSRVCIHRPPPAAGRIKAKGSSIESSGTHSG